MFVKVGDKIALRDLCFGNLTLFSPLISKNPCFQGIAPTNYFGLRELTLY